MVLIPDYLKTSSIQNSSKPRIISEVKKNCLSKLKLNFTTSFQDNGKTKFSGLLAWNIMNSEWVLRTGEVKQGSLILINKETAVIDLKLLLRGLNLLQCNTPRTFCLAEEKGIVFYKFQTLNETEYEKWVRILAVELIRQTPFQNIRFLDILSIIKTKDYENNNSKILKKGCSEECISKLSKLIKDTPKINCESSTGSTQFNQNEKKIKCYLEKSKNSQKERELIKIEVKFKNALPGSTLYFRNKKEKPWMRTQSMNNLVTGKEMTDESEISSGDENLSFLGNKNGFSFVPVRERKKFFESLNCKEIQRSESSPLVRSSSIGNTKNFIFIGNKLHKRKRTKSLHDLQKTPVKEICELFEPKSERKMLYQKEIGEKKTTILLAEKLVKKGERKLEKFQMQTIEVEKNIKIITEDLKSIEAHSLERNDSLELYIGLQRRLIEEKARLERLKEQSAKIVKDNLRNVSKLEKCNKKY